MIKKVCVFTGTRAEYGLLYWLMKDIEESLSLHLQIIASGSHLSPEFGLTYTEIEKDGFKIDSKVEMLLSSDTPVGIAKSMGVAVLGIADALDRLSPDYVVILGDRYEALAAAQTAQILRIPVVHLSGGEVTEGAYDDALRHAITKLSYLHFTSNQRYMERVIQLGEEPDRVFNVGSIGLEHLKRTELMSLVELSLSLKFDLNNPFFVVTYHPVTLADEDPVLSFKELLSSLDSFPTHQVILTYPNSDDGGRKIIPLLEQYSLDNPERILAIKSLGQLRYLSAIKYSAAVIGNSSSGIAEVPSFGTPTVNIGARQKGRLMAESIINCEPTQRSIKAGIDTAITLFMDNVVNPYGDGNSSAFIIKKLENGNSGRLTKKFFDIVGKS
jgi:UDP-N-acetylglucosamine 2-epimerase (non-hydrolysing)